MSDTTIAIAVVPFLVVLTLVLEGTRVGCLRICRAYRAARTGEQDRHSGDRKERNTGVSESA